MEEMESLDRQWRGGDEMESLSHLGTGEGMVETARASDVADQYGYCQGAVGELVGR